VRRGGRWRRRIEVEKRGGKNVSGYTIKTIF
jgi:hypothetical protein